MSAGMIDWLYGLQHFGVKLGLDPIRALLGVLGSPERAYPTVHVAGTNGKGSVAAMIDAMLAAADVRAGLFTSPHLVRLNERIRIAGRDIGDGELDRLLRRLRAEIEAGLAAGRLDVHPSFFEVVTACALQAFADHRVEAAVLEVGLGGRLDATNAVDADVAAIVSIDLDHTKTLGATLREIAGEKAGIVKPGQPLISGVVQQEAIDVVRRVCRERGAEWVDARSAVRLVAERGAAFDLETAGGRYEGLRLCLPGHHQIDNARIAVAAFERLLVRLGRRPDPAAVRAGLAAVRWPGRLQWIEDPATGVRFLLDAAHNPAGMAMLTAYLDAQRIAPSVLLFGATSGKPLDELLGALRSFVRQAVLTRPPVDRGIDPADLRSPATRWFETVVVEPEVAAAVDRARELAGAGGTVLVAGSLYLVGQVLGLLTGRPSARPIAL